MREAVSKVLTGTNYRLFFEPITRAVLIDTYGQLAALARRHQGDDGQWKAEMSDLLADPSVGPLRQWLLGLTKKTAQNLGLSVSEYPKAFEQLMDELSNCPAGLEPRESALLLWCGAATLTIRGSQKSRIGKALERSCAGAALSVIGLEENNDYWLDIGADQEVARQVDAEVATPRGRVRIEVGLIGVGNTEVIGDKVGRLDRNGVVLFDALPANSAMWATAQQHGVQLIPMRNNNPVEELRQHLLSLGVVVQTDPIDVAEVEERTLSMALDRFAQPGEAD